MVQQAAKSSDSADKLLLEIWSKAVDTQMHFNEMCVRSRQLGLTFVAAALGVAIVLMSSDKGFTIPLGQWQLHVAVLISIGALAGMLAVKKLDLGVYHRMLRGAVTFGEDFEEQYMKKRFFTLDKGMTQAISHYSRRDDATKTSDGPNGAYVYHGKSERNAETKLRAFYTGVVVSLSIVIGALLIVTNWSPMTELLNGRPFLDTLRNSHDPLTPPALSAPPALTGSDHGGRPGPDKPPSLQERLAPEPPQTGIYPNPNE